MKQQWCQFSSNYTVAFFESCYILWETMSVAGWLKFDIFLTIIKYSNSILVRSTKNIASSRLVLLMSSYNCKESEKVSKFNSFLYWRLYLQFYCSIKWVNLDIKHQTNTLTQTTLYKLALLSSALVLFINSARTQAHFTWT